MHHVFCVYLDWPNFCTSAHQCTLSVSVCLEGPIWYVLTNAPLLFGGAQVCYPVLNNAPYLLCLPEGPNSYVLTNAPRLLCLSGLAQSLFLCSPMHHVFCVCLKGPIWYVLTNAPLLTGGVQVCFLCSQMHLVYCVCRGLLGGFQSGLSCLLIESTSSPSGLLESQF